MLRLRTALLLLLFVAIADAATKSDPKSYEPQLLFVILTLAFWYIFSTSTNDLADEAIDKINLKDNKERPLANQEINRNYLVKVAILSGAAVVLCALAIGGAAAWLALAALGLSYFYSCPPVRLSARGIIAPLFLPLGYVVFPLALVSLVNSHRLWAGGWVLMGALYCSFVGRIILKDFRDVKGDRQYGKKTFIVRHRAAATCWVSAGAWVAGGLLMVIRFRHSVIFILCLLPFLAGVFYFLRQLSMTAGLAHQVSLVGIVGRFGNGAALLVLATLYMELSPQQAGTYSLLLVTLTLFNLYTVYVLYAPLLKRQLLESRN